MCGTPARLIEFLTTLTMVGPAWRVATESRRNELAGFRYSAGVGTIGISGIGGRMEGQPRAAPALVGRDGELGELLAGIDDVASGRGRLFLLAGDPGIGKSRLAYEAAARARDCGIKVEWGRCWEAGGAPAYWPWVQALRALVRGVGSQELRSQLGAGAPSVAQIVAPIVGGILIGREHLTLWAWVAALAALVGLLGARWGSSLARSPGMKAATEAQSSSPPS